MKLKIISELRLQDSGKCKSCKWNSYWMERGNWEWDCSHKLFNKLPDCEEADEIGNKENCPLWEPLNVSICEKHEFYFDKDGCVECEAEFYSLELDSCSE